MVRRIRRKFSDEFKQEAVRLANEGRRPMTEIAKELGIRADLLGKWRADADERAARTEADGAPLTKDEEIRRLKRELELARQERDFLKKATAYFAKESR
jgi:transposase